MSISKNHGGAEHGKYDLATFSTDSETLFMPLMTVSEQEKKLVRQCPVSS